uniref:Uncharacterized protein n=1 Tax=Schistocephalus solidus TaxID=70667 RepID=A0A0X3PH29_SCHSO
MGPPHLPTVFDVTDEADRGGGGAGCRIVFSRGFQNWLAAQIEAANPLQVAERLALCCRRHLAAIAPMWMELSQEERNRVCSEQQAVWFDELLHLLFPPPKQPSASEALEYFRQRHQKADSPNRDPTPVSAYLHKTEQMVDDVLIDQTIEKTYRDAIVLICLGALLNKHPQELMEHFSTQESNISRSPSIQNNTSPGAAQQNAAGSHSFVSRSQTEVGSGQYQIVHQTIANFDTVPSGFRQRTEYTTNDENVKINRVMEKDSGMGRSIAKGTVGSLQELHEAAVETAGWELDHPNVSRHSTEVSVSFPRSTPRTASALSDSPTFSEPDSNATPPMRRCSLLPCFTLWRPRSLGKTTTAPAGATIVIQTSTKDMHAQITVSSADSSAFSDSQPQDKFRTREFSFNIQKGVPVEVRLADAKNEERKRRFSDKRLPMEMAEGRLFRSSKGPDSLTEVTSSLTNSQSLAARAGRTSASFHLRDGVPLELSLSGRELDEEKRSLRLSTATDEALQFLASKIVQQVLTALNLPSYSQYSSTKSSVTSDLSVTEPISLPGKGIRTNSADGSSANSISRPTTEIAASVVKKIIRTVVEAGQRGSRLIWPESSITTVEKSQSDNGSRHMPTEVVVCDPITQVVQQTKPEDCTITLDISITLPNRRMEIQQRHNISAGAKT